MSIYRNTSLGVVLLVLSALASSSSATQESSGDVSSELRRIGVELSKLEDRATHPRGVVDRGDIEPITRKLELMAGPVVLMAKSGDPAAWVKYQHLSNQSQDLLSKIDRAAFEKRSPRDRQLLQASEDCSQAPEIQPGHYVLPKLLGLSNLGSGATELPREVWVPPAPPPPPRSPPHTPRRRADTELALFLGCGDEPVIENDDTVGLSSAVALSVKAEQVIYVRLRTAGQGFAYLNLDAEGVSRGAAEGGSASLSGTVTDAKTGQPVSVFVEAFNSAGFYAGGDSTNGQGQYSIANLDADAYRIRTRGFGAGFRDQIFDRISCQTVCPVELGTPVPLAAGEDRQGIDFPLVEGHSIFGRVRMMGTGIPLSGIRATLYDSEGLELETDFTDTAGRFELGGALPGSFRVKISDPKYQDLLWQQIECDDGCDVTTGTPIEVVDGDVSGIDFETWELASISGVVTDELTGEPIQSTMLTLFDSTGGSLGNVFSDSDGSYRLSGMAAGTYFVRAQDFGYVTEIWDDIACPDNCNPTLGTPVEVAELQTVQGIDFALKPPGSITGVTTDELTGEALGHRVRLYTPTGEFLDQDFASSTTGRFSFSVVEGEYRVAAEPSFGYLAEVWNDLPCLEGGCDPSSGDPVHVVVGQETDEINFALIPNPSILGRVTEQVSGEAISSARVSLLTELGVEIETVFSDSQGDYELEDLEPGTYYVKASRSFDDFVDELYDNIPCNTSCDLALGVAIEVQFGSRVEGIDFSLSRNPSIRGTLTELGGGALQYPAAVDLYNQEGLRIRTSQAAAGAGEYGFEDVLPGTYFLVARGQDYVPRLWQEIDCWPSVDQGGCDVTGGTPVEVELDDVEIVDMEMDAGGSISGSLVAASDRGVDLDPFVYLYDAAGEELVRRDLPSEGGSWRIAGLLTGDYYVIVRGGFGYRDEVWPGAPCEPRLGSDCSPLDGAAIAVTRGTDSADIHLTLEPFGRLRGRVTSSETGQPALGGDVRAFDTNGNFVAVGFPNGTGEYEITALLPGTYQLITTSTPHFLEEVLGAGPCEVICDPSDGTLIPVAFSADVADLSFELKRSSGFFGRVTDLTTGSPVSNVAIDFWDEQGNWVQTGVTDQTGRYSIDLDEGHYFITTDNGQGFMDEVWNDVACPDGPAFEGLCDPLIGQSLEASEIELPLEVSFALSDASVIFADGFESGDLGPWAAP